MKTALAIAVVTGFAIGVLVRDVAQDWKDRDAGAALREEIRQCHGHGSELVLRANAEPMCIAMMPRLDLDWPIHPNPIRLTPKEIRHATGH